MGGVSRQLEKQDKSTLFLSSEGQLVIGLVEA